MHVLSFESLSKKYGKKTALYPLSHTFSEGIHAILGPNGAGKTTLMKLLCGALKPSSGVVTYDEQDIRALKQAYRRQLAVLFQRQPMYNNYTAMEHLEFMGYLKGVSHPEILRHGTDLLEFTGLADQRNRRIATFSGGMRQRLAIAGTLLGNPQILMLDEPSVGLDLQEREALKQLLRKIRKERIILISTHIVPDVDRICDHVLLMQEGKILKQGDVKSMVADLDGAIWTVPESDHSLIESFSHYFVNGEMRVKSAQPPTPHSTISEVTLEDVYFCTVQPRKWEGLL